MVLLVDYNTLEIEHEYDSTIYDIMSIIKNLTYKNEILHTPNGFYFDDSLLKSDDEWFNKFIKTKEYKVHMRKIKLEKLYIK